MVIEHAPLEDELGDVLEKAMRCAELDETELGSRAGVPAEKIRDAWDYRYDFTADETLRLARELGLNEIGVVALASGRYPLPAIGGLPFCLYPLRTPHGIGVANAYIVADCGSQRGILFDTGADPEALRRVWPANIRHLDAIFITHPETEHLAGLADVQRRFGPVPVFGPVDSAISGAVALQEGSRMKLGIFDVETLATPGHAEAHNCYVVRAAGMPGGRSLLVSGDILFAGSIGGAYFCSERLKKHVKRLLELPADTAVAPGHGPLTTIQNECTYNPFVF
ncbi:MBL fold metallo-hydrolase [Rariglobus hedericola]|uniref:MBL fold metallo-hydrolase n=1 Tax=Rariglobus hedericola TaxID=2597822 RepID=A0A556QNZ0_9BACT|nr:MBL fold metallo-hydrolase [Rariglobus hedericola]TSJ78351.1 MBL fold metallo-hydrolase [Rariglobus hedericola]